MKLLASFLFIFLLAVSLSLSISLITSTDPTNTVQQPHEQKGGDSVKLRVKRQILNLQDTGHLLEKTVALFAFWRLLDQTFDNTTDHRSSTLRPDKLELLTSDGQKTKNRKSSNAVTDNMFTATSLSGQAGYTEHKKLTITARTETMKHESPFLSLTDMTESTAHRELVISTIREQEIHSTSTQTATEAEDDLLSTENFITQSLPDTSEAPLSLYKEILSKAVEENSLATTEKQSIDTTAMTGINDSTTVASFPADLPSPVLQKTTLSGASELLKQSTQGLQTTEQKIPELQNAATHQHNLNHTAPTTEPQDLEHTPFPERVKYEFLKTTLVKPVVQGNSNPTLPAPIEELKILESPSQTSTVNWHDVKPTLLMTATDWQVPGPTSSTSILEWRIQDPTSPPQTVESLNREATSHELTSEPHFPKHHKSTHSFSEINTKTNTTKSPDSFLQPFMTVKSHALTNDSKSLSSSNTTSTSTHPILEENPTVDSGDSSAMMANSQQVSTSYFTPARPNKRSTTFTALPEIGMPTTYRPATQKTQLQSQSASAYAIPVTQTNMGKGKAMVYNSGSSQRETNISTQASIDGLQLSPTIPAIKEKITLFNVPPSPNPSIKTIPTTTVIKQGFFTSSRPQKFLSWISTKQSNFHPTETLGPRSELANQEPTAGTEPKTSDGRKTNNNEQTSSNAVTDNMFTATSLRGQAGYTKHKKLIITARTKTIEHESPFLSLTDMTESTAHRELVISTIREQEIHSTSTKTATEAEDDLLSTEKFMDPVRSPTQSLPDTSEAPLSLYKEILSKAVEENSLATTEEQIIGTTGVTGINDSTTVASFPADLPSPVLRKTTQSGAPELLKQSTQGLQTTEQKIPELQNAATDQNNLNHTAPTTEPQDLEHTPFPERVKHKFTNTTAVKAVVQGNSNPTLPALIEELKILESPSQTSTVNWHDVKPTLLMTATDWQVPGKTSSTSILEWRIQDPTSLPQTVESLNPEATSHELTLEPHFPKHHKSTHSFSEINTKTNTTKSPDRSLQPFMTVKSHTLTNDSKALSSSNTTSTSTHPILEENPTVDLGDSSAMMANSQQVSTSYFTPARPNQSSPTFTALPEIGMLTTYRPATQKTQLQSQSTSAYAIPVTQTNIDKGKAMVYNSRSSQRETNISTQASTDGLQLSPTIPAIKERITLFNVPPSPNPSKKTIPTTTVIKQGFFTSSRPQKFLYWISTKQSNFHPTETLGPRSELANQEPTAGTEPKTSDGQKTNNNEQTSSNAVTDNMFTATSLRGQAGYTEHKKLTITAHTKTIEHESPFLSLTDITESTAHRELVISTIREQEIHSTSTQTATEAEDDLLSTEKFTDTVRSPTQSLPDTSEAPLSLYKEILSKAVEENSLATTEKQSIDTTAMTGINDSTTVASFPADLPSPVLRKTTLSGAPELLKQSTQGLQTTDQNNLNHTAPTTEPQDLEHTPFPERVKHEFTKTTAVKAVVQDDSNPILPTPTEKSTLRASRTQKFLSWISTKKSNFYPTETLGPLSDLANQEPTAGTEPKENYGNNDQLTKLPKSTQLATMQSMMRPRLSMTPITATTSMSRTQTLSDIKHHKTLLILFMATTHKPANPMQEDDVESSRRVFGLLYTLGCLVLMILIVILVLISRRKWQQQHWRKDIWVAGSPFMLGTYSVSQKTRCKSYSVVGLMDENNYKRRLRNSVYVYESVPLQQQYEQE